MALDADRRAGLERSRAIAIARDHFGLDADDPSVEVDATPFGVSVASSDHAVIVSSLDDLSVLGGVLVWLDRRSISRCALVVEHHSGIHARRAAMLAPELDVHELDGSSIELAVPDEIAESRSTPDDIAALVEMIERSGAEVVIEDGIVRAEVAGLEVGRVVTGPAGSVLEVGVGRFDREAGALLHADRPVEPTLVATVEQISVHRRAGADPHPINRIARDRWLREVIRSAPHLVGVSDPVLVEPVPPRTSLLKSSGAALIARAEGLSVLVVCSVGVELGLIPATSDLLARHRPDEVRFVIPERDRLPYLENLAKRLGVPVEIVDVEVPWADGSAN